MKNLILTILTLASFIIASCDTNKGDELTDQDKATIKSEVHSVFEQIVENSEAGNLEKATEPYADDPEFICISNGAISDYNGFIESNREYFNALDHQTFNETAMKFTFINKETVILTYGASALANLKDKQKLKIDPFAATLVFRKINDSWRVTYSHESGVFTPIVADSTMNE